MNRESQARAMQLRVGVFVVIALVAFLGMIYMLGARARLFEARYTLHADFTEVGGLAEGATVRLAGVQIGRVTAVHLPGEPGGKVRVDMSIAKQYATRVRKDSVARIETQGLLGDKILEITVGTAKAPPAQAGDVLVARDPTDIGQVLSEGAATVKSVAALAEGLRTITEELNRSHIVQDASATLKTARRATEQISREAGQVLAEARGVTSQASRIVDRIEKGPGWAHVLLYEEPVALRKLNDVIASTQALVERIERGEGAAGVLTSKESTAAAQRLVKALERFGGAGEAPHDDDGLLPALLFDPKYKKVLDDLGVVAKNFRDVSDRVAGGRGTIGSLVKDEPTDGGIRQASRDLQTALANLKEITEKLNEGEGTIGALIADPTIYERLVSILEGAQRSFLLRGLLRGLGGGGKDREPAADGDKRSDGEKASPRERDRR
ncbi:MAG: MCE family protein [Candidatus Rokubacteria bacterium]|nr:MCE family protein [Candidatus Rokubacteria bacterium]